MFTGCIRSLTRDFGPCKTCVMSRKYRLSDSGASRTQNPVPAPRYGEAVRDSSAPFALRTALRITGGVGWRPIGRRKPIGQRIAIIGGGALGGYVGAHMAQAGEDVIFIDAWPERVERMRTAGLRVPHLREVPEFTVKVRASSRVCTSELRCPQ